MLTYNLSAGRQDDPWGLPKTASFAELRNNKRPCLKKERLIEYTQCWPLSPFAHLGIYIHTRLHKALCLSACVVCTSEHTHTMHMLTTVTLKCDNVEMYTYVNVYYY